LSSAAILFKLRLLHRGVHEGDGGQGTTPRGWGAVSGARRVELVKNGAKGMALEQPFLEEWVKKMKLPLKIALVLGFAFTWNCDLCDD
jgi:hypothetical protein